MAVLGGIGAFAGMAASAKADFNSYPGPKATVQDFNGQKLLNFYGTDQNDTIIARPVSGKLRVTINGGAVLLDGPAAALGCKNGDGSATVCPFAFDTLTVAGWSGSDTLDLREVPKPEIAYVDGTVPGSSTILGGPMNDKLYGGVGNDKIDGGAGDDFLGGGAGADAITGGAGKDFLNGENGNDVFHAADGEKDFLDCDSTTPDNDSGEGDAIDTAVNCESVSKPPTPVDPAEPAPTPPPIEPAPTAGPVHTPSPTVTATPEPPAGGAFNADDQDGDDDFAIEDCDDHDASINHNAVDIPGDGIDQNCDSRDAFFPLFDTLPDLRFQAKHKSTSVFFFKLPALPAGTTYSAVCDGKHCPKPALGTVTTKQTINLKKAYHGHKLPPGTKITVRMSAPGTVSYNETWTTQKDFDPKTKVRCIDPGGKKHDCFNLG
ncbi:MAG: hypothetical protein QOF76_1223 [Solirubrobacteraceae bacterium]|jgi:Ca2+-binding RTX toxin-like protein|nr:hypothetical protein [Solirubrobacteraceae bacterium]